MSGWGPRWKWKTAINASQPSDLSASYGSSPSDLSGDYSAESTATIDANLFNAGQDLVDYVLATCGKEGVTPYVSTYAEGRDAILNISSPSCQE